MIRNGIDPICTKFAGELDNSAHLKAHYKDGVSRLKKAAH